MDLLANVQEDAKTSYPATTRDREADYIVANAVIYRVRYLPSGDRDLLVLGEFEGVRIVSPAEFVKLLEREDQPPH